MGGPALNPTIQRSTRLRSSHESAGWSRRYSRRAADLFAASAVNGGTLPSGDGVFQRLRLPPGEHEIELYLEGHESIREMLYLVPGETYKIQHEMQLLSEGVTQAPRPEPLETPVAPPFPARGGRGAAPPGVVAERFGTLAVRIQPADAEVLIDGERRHGFEGADRLVVELGAGLHVVEVRRDGYRPYRTDVDVRDGDTTLLNVSLPRTDGDTR